ncbi:hypothetical protein [Actinomadura syzygii]|uniref:Uncharacterized protein n=1 Tax=Actinomadura syzygii TaxID=1427538 RepID=A0A5D0UDN1_9ACTN|nr:hypothetical protein [Actinomadura syzygii]TYC16601.1 hypothetical protein FXF65_08435 [Actinomadura syzygii]
MPVNEHTRPPPRRSVDWRTVRRTARRVAEPAGWWTVLLAGYLAMVSAVTPLEISVGAGAAAAGAAAAVAGRRALFDSSARPDGDVHSARMVAAGAVSGALLPWRIVADTARIVARGASGGDWTRLSVAPGPAARGAATLLMSASPATFVAAVDPGRGLLRVHRLTPGVSAFERRLRRTGLIAAPEATDRGTTGRGASDPGRARGGNAE